MNLSDQLASTIGGLQHDESAIIDSLETPLSKTGATVETETARRACRGEFLAEILKLLAADDKRTVISLPNLRLVSALDATSLRTEKAVFLTGIHSESPLMFNQCDFNQLDLSGGTLTSLFARGVHLERDLVLQGARISHVLDLSIARIGGTLNLQDTVLTIPGQVEEAAANSGDTAQEESGQTRREAYARHEMGSLLDIRIEGSLRLCNARIDRKIRMTNARVGGDVDLWGVEFQDVGDLENGLICTNCEIGEKLILSESRCDDHTRIALDYTRLRIIEFGRDESSWPRPNRISLEGTTFEAFAFIQRQKEGHALNVFDTDLTIAILKRNGPGFYRQPWRQPAQSIRQKGYGQEALEIMVAMEREASQVEAKQHRARLSESGLSAWDRVTLMGKRFRRTVSNSLWWFADYGYRPEKALWTLIVLLLVNVGLNVAILYWQQDAIVPALEEVYLQDDKDPWQGTPREYPSFNPLVFALDTLIPALDLGQENAWQPNWKNPFGIAYAIYLYIIHMFFGLLLIGVLVAGISKRLSDEI